VLQKPGLTKWRYELREEIDRNEDLQSQLRALSAHTKEDVRLVPNQNPSQRELILYTSVMP
jgi:hypothetical protein